MHIRFHSLVDEQISSPDLGTSEYPFLARLPSRTSLTAALCSTYTRETAETDYASNGNGVFHCSSSSSSSATHSSTTVAPPPSSSTTSSSTAQPTSTSSAGTTSASPTPTTSDTSSATTSQQESQSVSAVSTVLHSSSELRTYESQTTINGTATSVPVVSTIVTMIPSTVSSNNGSAVGLGTTGSGHKSNTAAIAGGVVGGVAGLVLFGILGAWYARSQRKGAGPGGPTLNTDTSVAGPSGGPISPNMAERSTITPFLAGQPSRLSSVLYTYSSHVFPQRATPSRPRCHQQPQGSGHACSTAQRTPPLARLRQVRVRVRARGQYQVRAPCPLAPTRAKPSPPHTGARRARAATASQATYRTLPRWTRSSPSCKRRMRGGSLVAASGYRLRTRANGMLSDRHCCLAMRYSCRLVIVAVYGQGLFVSRLSVLLI